MRGTVLIWTLKCKTQGNNPSRNRVLLTWFFPASGPRKTSKRYAREMVKKRPIYKKAWRMLNNDSERSWRTIWKRSRSYEKKSMSTLSSLPSHHITSQLHPFYFRQIAQLQLKKLLDKYDQEVGSRTSTGRELQAIYENEMTFLRKLEETCGAQEIQYDTLMHQKETEEKQWQEERMLLFMMNRAARIIQRNWRMVMAKKRLKKGKRGKGKGKKT